jgi:hypothetical protein
MCVERSRSFKAARSFALFAGVAAFNTSYLLGQAAPPVPANPFKKAVAQPVMRLAAERPPVAPAANATATDWDEDGDEEEVERVAAEPIGARVNIMQMPISVERSIFGVGDLGGDDVRGELRLKKLLHDKLVLVRREFPDLNDVEIQRLEKAGLGDIKRFQDQVAALNAKHRETLWTDAAGRQELIIELPKLQYRMRGVHFFGNQSLLTKTLRVVVTKNQLTAKELPGEGHALNLPDGPPVPNGGFAIRQVQLADGKKAIALEHHPLQPPMPLIRGPRPQAPIPLVAIEMPQVRRPLPALSPLLKPVLRVDDKYYLKLSQLISDNLKPDLPIRNEQREPLLAMLRRTSKQVPQIPLFDPDVALCRISELPDEEYLTVLDAKQWKALQLRFEAAKGRQEKRIPGPMPPIPGTAPASPK